jgi:uncharacterized phage protein gp47/JayE
MPWTTPTLRAVRETVRGEITTALGRASFVGNSVLRVMADATAALTHLTLRYLDWVALQLLPDTAEHEWLDRHGIIWLANADGSKGRKVGTFASGSVTVTGTTGIILDSGTQFTGGDNWPYESTELVYVTDAGAPVAVRALNAGAGGNKQPDDILSLVTGVAGVSGEATVVTLDGGVDPENDDQLRQRILLRIQQPPMGGDAEDYVQWALEVPGVTRAWCSPLEMGIGTVTVRFMMDELRADNNGFPTEDDCITVAAYLATVRPVAVKDFYVVAPIPQPIDCQITQLVIDSENTRGGIETSLTEMLLEMAAPGQTIFEAWKSYAIMSAPNVNSFLLINAADDVMPSPGHMAVLGSVIYDD